MYILQDMTTVLKICLNVCGLTSHASKSHVQCHMIFKGIIIPWTQADYPNISYQWCHPPGQSGFV